MLKNGQVSKKHCAQKHIKWSTLKKYLKYLKDINKKNPLALSGGPYLIDPCKKDETQKISGFYQRLALQHLRPKGYKKCMKLPYYLFCPSTEANNANYVYPYIFCKKIFTTKKLLLYYLKAKEETDMISIEDDMHKDEERTLDIVDGPCVIPNIEKYLEQPSEMIYE